MIVALWILLLALVATVVVGVANGRHKLHPHLFLIFGGAMAFVIATLAVYYFLPDREELFFGLVGITLGGLFVCAGAYNLSARAWCRTVVQGVYQGYQTYYGGNGASTQAPVFSYTVDGRQYREQSPQSEPLKLLRDQMRPGQTYSIYVDPKHPALFVLRRRIHVGECLMIAVGLFFLLGGIGECFTGL